MKILDYFFHWFLLRNPVLVKILQVVFSQNDSVFLYDVGNNAFSPLEEQQMEDVIQKSFLENKQNFVSKKLQILACGSIGRVYRYENMCIKVQIPHIKTRIQQNVRIVLPLLKIADFLTTYRFHLGKRCFSLMESIEQQYDFEKEVFMNRAYADNLRRFDIQDVHVPEIYWSNPHCICMEYIDGECVAKTTNVSPEIVKLHLANFILFDYIHLDLHGGNIIVKDKQFYVIDFGMMQKHIGYVRSLNAILFLRAFLKNDFELVAKIALKTFFFSDKQCTRHALHRTDLLKEIEFHLSRQFHLNFNKGYTTQLMKCQQALDEICTNCKPPLYGDTQMSYIGTCVVHLVRSYEKSKCSYDYLKSVFKELQRKHDQQF